MPAPLRPYFRLARIDRPIGTWLLLLPGLWAISMATPGWPSPWLFALFGVGAIVMRAAGCVVNDLADRKFDAMVARTAARPIASGAISIPAALVFLAALLNHPVLLDRFAEEIAEVALAAPELDKLRQEILMVYAERSDLDSEALGRHLTQRELAPFVDTVCAAEVYVHGAFARADASLEAAMSGFTQALRRLLAPARRAAPTLGQSGWISTSPSCPSRT